MGCAAGFFDPQRRCQTGGDNRCSIRSYQKQTNRNILANQYRIAGCSPHSAARAGCIPSEMVLKRRKNLALSRYMPTIVRTLLWVVPRTIECYPQKHFTIQDLNKKRPAQMQVSFFNFPSGQFLKLSITYSPSTNSWTRGLNLKETANLSSLLSIKRKAPWQ